VQALQAQLLQRLAVSGVSGGTASLSHISELPQQTVAGSNGLPHSLQPMQPRVNVSVMSQHQQAMPSKDGCAPVKQQDHCLNSSVSWCDNTNGHYSQSNQMLTEAYQHSEEGLSHSASSEVLQSSQAVTDASESYSQSQPAQLQHLGQGTCTDRHNSSQSLTNLTPVHSQSSNHSRVIEQLQQQLLQSSAKHAVNECAAAATGDNCLPNAEEGEVDSIELMQFLS